MATTASGSVPANRAEGFEDTAKRWGGRLLRFVQSMLVVAMAVILGLYLGRRYGFLMQAAGGEWVNVSLGSVAGLSMLKEFLTLFPKFWEYVKSGKVQNLYDFSSFIFLGSLTLALAFFAIAAKAAPLAPGPTPQQGAVGQVVFIQPSGRGTKFLVPFINDAEGCDDQSDNFRKGLIWLDGTEKFMDQLAQGLSHCATPGKPVRVEIKGFASSADFKCNNSNDLNVRIANLRARKVQDEMNRALGASAGAIMITARAWENSEFQAMRKDALFNDRDETGPVKGRGDLTRRADIVVTDAGDCEPR